MKKEVTKQMKRNSIQTYSSDLEPTVFSSRLISVMDETKMKGNELANKLYLTPATITCYRKAYRTPDLYTFSELVNALDVSADYLLGRIDVPYPVYQDTTLLESQILHNLRLLDKEDQKAVACIIQNLLK